MTGLLVFLLRILLTVSLYAFLLGALYTLWQELRTHQSLVSVKKIQTITLRVLDMDVCAAHEFNLNQITIGRDPQCDLYLTNELVSAQHARISFHHNQWWVEDLQSTNGTFLNDERVYTPTVLITHDEIRCGVVHVEITFGDPLGAS